MAKKVGIDRLADEIQNVLEKYGDDITKNVTEAVKEVTKAGAKTVQQNARSSFKGNTYAKGWKSKVETNRLGADGVIYNASVPGLPHLLEKGHAKRGGGRVDGVAHIRPVEKKIETDFTKAIERAI